MKTIPTVLAVSLALNFLFGLVLVFGGDAPAAKSRSPSSPSSAAALPVPGGPSFARVGPREERPAGGAAPAVSANLVAVRDCLRSLGVSERVLRQTLSVMQSARYHARLVDIMTAARNRDGRGYWQPDDVAYPFANFPLERLAELRELSRQNRAELRQLLGPAPLDPALVYQMRREFLPPEKYEQLAELESDYAELRMQAMREVRGFGTAEDQARLKLLQQEKERDLAALFTPEEKEQYELRQSNAAMQLRQRLNGFAATEAEYRALYALIAAQEKQFPLNSDLTFVTGNYTSPAYLETMRARSAAQATLNQQIEQALGAERYAAYQRAQDRDYQRLQAAAQRFDLATTTVDQVYALRQKAIDTSQALKADATMSTADRRAALTQLAAETRQQVRTSLGPTIGDAYLQQSMTWLNSLERGYPLRVHPSGFVVPDLPTTPPRG